MWSFRFRVTKLPFISRFRVGFVLHTVATEFMVSFGFCFGFCDRDFEFRVSRWAEFSVITIHSSYVLYSLHTMAFPQYCIHGFRSIAGRLQRLGCQRAYQDPKHHPTKAIDRFWNMWQCIMWLNPYPLLAFLSHFTIPLI